MREDLSYKEVAEETYVFDAETGEIFRAPLTDHLESVPYAHIGLPQHTASLRKPSECKTLEELEDVCTNDDKTHQTIEFDSGKLFDIVKSKIIEFDGILQWRAMQLAALINQRNVAITDTVSLSKAIGVSPSHLSRELAPLIEGGFIKVFTPRGLREKTRVILFNPHLFWKGDWEKRNAIRRKALLTGEWE
ncbi:hypothetical protein E4630_17025 [Aeromonas hydrophila]|uniref:hypothetical protein n=1 Tax=Aeromonas hydrophila TaxID=644 RepID=UPI00107ED722|nr:hypothetical protein [Aeromonas hydrophila]QBX72407.1 hypothetical protein E4625_17250 [Aeromonas hydrophila]QBX77108.1 hypothetical protein E4630_17025 [Aeromonas hydrophila]